MNNYLTKTFFYDQTGCISILEPPFSIQGLSVFNTDGNLFFISKGVEVLYGTSKDNIGYVPMNATSSADSLVLCNTGAQLNVLINYYPQETKPVEKGTAPEYLTAFFFISYFCLAIFWAMYRYFISSKLKIKI